MYIQCKRMCFKFTFDSVHGKTKDLCKCLASSFILHNGKCILYIKLTLVLFFIQSWNQLPRCQRNLIIMGITAFCVTLLLFLPGDQLINMKDVRQKPAAAPFHMRRENTLQNPHHHPNLDADKNNNNDNLPSDILAAVASPMTIEHLAKDKVSKVIL